MERQVGLLAQLVRTKWHDPGGRSLQCVRVELDSKLRVFIPHQPHCSVLALYEVSQ